MSLKGDSVALLCTPSQHSLHTHFPDHVRWENEPGLSGESWAGPWDQEICRQESQTTCGLLCPAKAVFLPRLDFKPFPEQVTPLPAALNRPLDQHLGFLFRRWPRTTWSWGLVLIFILFVKYGTIGCCTVWRREREFESWDSLLAPDLIYLRNIHYGCANWIGEENSRVSEK